MALFEGLCCQKKKKPSLVGIQIVTAEPCWPLDARWTVGELYDSVDKAVSGCRILIVRLSEVGDGAH